MANTMKQSAVAGKAPTTDQLKLGELAVNTVDGKLFTKRKVDGVETVVEIAAAAPCYQGSIQGVAGSNFSPTLSDEISVGFTKSGVSLVVPVAGRYLLIATQLLETGAGAALYFCIRRNGVIIKHAYLAPSRTVTDLTVQAIMACAVGDTLQLYYSGTVAAGWGANHSSISVTYLGN